jgi:hypothetical protein
MYLLFYAHRCRVGVGGASTCISTTQLSKIGISLFFVVGSSKGVAKLLFLQCRTIILLRRVIWVAGEVAYFPYNACHRAYLPVECCFISLSTDFQEFITSRFGYSCLFYPICRITRKYFLFGRSIDIFCRRPRNFATHRLLVHLDKAENRYPSASPAWVSTILPRDRKVRGSFYCGARAVRRSTKCRATVWQATQKVRVIGHASEIPHSQNLQPECRCDYRCH